MTTSTAATSTILIGISGILSDATSLLQIAYSQLEEEQSLFGWHRLHLYPVGHTHVSDQNNNEGLAYDNDAIGRFGGNAGDGGIGGAKSFSEDDAIVENYGTGPAIFGKIGGVTSSPSFLTISTQPTATEASETTLRLSQTIADQCQKHAFGGGLRPLGASLLLAGVDRHACCRGIYHSSETSNDGHYQNSEQDRKGNMAKKQWQQQGARISMCETDPSGSWRSQVRTVKSRNIFRSDCTVKVEKNGNVDWNGDVGVKTKTRSTEETMEHFSISPPQIMVSGGPTKSQSKLKSSMESQLRQLYQQSFNGLDLDTTKKRNGADKVDGVGKKNAIANDEKNGLFNAMEEENYETLFLRKVLRTIVSTLVEEWKSRKYQSWFHFSASSYDPTNAGQQSQLPVPLPQMEVVFVSAKRGTFRLTQQDIAALMSDGS